MKLVPRSYNVERPLTQAAEASEHLKDANDGARIAKHKAAQYRCRSRIPRRYNKRPRVTLDDDSGQKFEGFRNLISNTRHEEFPMRSEPDAELVFAPCRVAAVTLSLDVDSQRVLL